MAGLTDMNMQEELFIGPYIHITAAFPPEPREKFREALSAKKSKADVIAAILSLNGLCRAQRVITGERFTGEEARQFIEDMKLLKSTEYEDMAGGNLVSEGSYCEQVGDFEGAVLLYEAAMDFDIKERRAAYYRFNNLGFCLNYLKRFDEAVSFLEKAIEMEPKAYNAFKNIGVSYEHLGKTEDAAKSYMHAINYSNGESRCIKHLLRLVARNPELKNEEHVVGYLKSLKEHGKI